MLTRVRAAVLTAAAAGAAALAWAPPGASAAPDGGGSCGASGYQWGYDVSCQSGTATTGTPGEGRPAAATGAAVTPCALYPVAGNPAQMLQVCPHGLIVAGGRNGVNLINATTTVIGTGAAAPAVTPQQLLAWAQDDLALPLPDVLTARPRAAGALVGLPEWFWVSPAQWHPVTAAVAAGGAWAQVTARPARLEVRPGDSGALSCPGPGTAYDPRLPAAAQHSTCTWTYSQPSDGLPGNRYQVSVTVTWTASWLGSGGAGGALPPLARTTTFGLAAGEAQSLIQGSNP